MCSATFLSWSAILQPNRPERLFELAAEMKISTALAIVVNRIRNSVELARWALKTTAPIISLHCRKRYAGE